MILLDTHVMLWLYIGADRQVPAPVLHRIDEEAVGVSPFVQLELSFLHEIGRLRVPANTLFDELGPRLEMEFTNPPSGTICEIAANLHWTRDPFDRLLSAHAVAEGAVLVTKDKTIRQHLDLAWWGE